MATPNLTDVLEGEDRVTVEGIAKALNVEDFANVDTTTPTQGQVLTYDEVTGWTPDDETDTDTTDHTALTNIGTNTHAEIDTHIGDATTHFTQSSISITESQISDLGTYLTDITGADLDDLADLDTTGVADGYYLVYNSTSGNWEAEAFTGATQLSELSDVFSSLSPSESQVLTYTVANGWNAVTPDSTTTRVNGYATSDGQTVFSGAYNVSAVDVLVEGIKLHPDEYTATNGTSVTLDFGVDEGTWVQILSNDEAGTGSQIDWTVDQGATNIHSGNYTDTVYTHPTYDGDDISIDTTALTGAYVISDLDFNVTTDSTGHVTDANATVSTRELTAANIGAATTTHVHSSYDYNTALTNGTVFSNIVVTDGIVTTVSTRSLSASDVGALGATAQATDSDQLDGFEATQFLRSDVADIKTAGDLTFNDNVDLNFGTGNDAKFYCTGSHMYTDLQTGIGNWYIRDGTTTRFTFDDAGHFTATGAIQASTFNESAVRQDSDTSGSGGITFDYENGDMRQFTATGNITSITFSNFSSGNVCGYIIDAVNWGTYTITHPTGMLFASGAAPSYTASGTDRLLVMKDKNGVYTLTVIALDIGTA